MRKIKFRAWDIKEKDWINPNNVRLCTEYTDENGFFVFEVAGIADAGIVFMQLTGLKDKNGKEIYEGDILDDGDGGVVTVLFEEGCFWFAYDDFNKGTYYWLKERGWDHKIIGNLCENPELLEAKK